MLWIIVGILGLVEFAPGCFEHHGADFSLTREMGDDSWWLCAILSVMSLGLCVYGLF